MCTSLEKIIIFRKKILQKTIKTYLILQKMLTGMQNIPKTQKSNIILLNSHYRFESFNLNDRMNRSEILDFSIKTY